MDLSIDKLGRVVIPKEVRDRYQIHPGSTVRLEEIPGGIVLVPISDHAVLQERDGFLVHTGEAAGDLDVDRTIQQQRTARALRDAGVPVRG